MKDTIIGVIKKEFDVGYSKACNIYEIIEKHAEILDELTEVLDKQDVNIIKNSKINIDEITAYDLMITKTKYPVKSYYYLALLKYDKPRAIRELQKMK